MKRSTTRSRRSGFSLIEMIGVLAVMSIIAAVVLPASLRLMDSAAIRSEKETLKSYSAAITEYVRYNLAFPATTPVPVYPTPLPWSTAITTPRAYSSDAPINMRRNARNVDRVFIVEPGANPVRAILISGMRDGISLPSVTSLTASTATFDAVWNAQENAVPSGGTGLWAAWAGWGDYLCIERMNFASELQYVTIALRNLSSSTVSYEAIAPNGTTVVLRANLSATTNFPITNARPRWRINLYNVNMSTVASPTLIYMVTPNGRTIDYVAATGIWTPQ